MDRQGDSQTYGRFQTINVQPKGRRDLRIKTKDRSYRKAFRTHPTEWSRKKETTFVRNVYSTGTVLLFVVPVEISTTLPSTPAFPRALSSHLLFIYFLSLSTSVLYKPRPGFFSLKRSIMITSIYVHLIYVIGTNNGDSCSHILVLCKCYPIRTD